MNSMTGFGRADGVIFDWHYIVEVKSVNHRYLEHRFRMPAGLSLLEIPLTELIRKRFERGSFEISIRNRLSAKKGVIKGGARFAVDTEALESFLKSLELVSKKIGKKVSVTPESLISMGHVIVSEEPDRDVDMLEPLKLIVDQAFSNLLKMRKAEGDRLCEILGRHLSELKTIGNSVKKEAAEQPQLIRERLSLRLKTWKLENIDPQRLEVECLIHADKADVSEEIDRLFHHIQAFEECLISNDAIGRKLDFVLQELNREVNTLGSKAASLSLYQCVIQAKHCIEKLREQAQNVE